MCLVWCHVVQNINLIPSIYLAKGAVTRALKSSQSYKHSFSSLSVSSQDSIVALGNAHAVFQKFLQGWLPNRTNVSLIECRSFSTTGGVGEERVGEGGGGLGVKHRLLLFYTPLSFRLEILWKFFKPLNTSALSSCRPETVLARLSFCLFLSPPPPLHTAWLQQ